MLVGDPIGKWCFEKKRGFSVFRGFLHTHISFLTDSCPVCLMLLTVDRNAFFEMSEVRRKFLERMAKNNLLTVLTDACEAKQGIGLGEVSSADNRKNTVPSQPTPWIQTTLAAPRRTKPAGLSESSSVMVIFIIVHHYDNFCMTYCMIIGNPCASL